MADISSGCETLSTMRPHSLPLFSRMLRCFGYALGSFLCVLYLGLLPSQAFLRSTTPPLLNPSPVPWPIQPFLEFQVAEAPLTSVPLLPRHPGSHWQTGYQNYQAGRFTAAIDQWQQAALAYQRQDQPLEQAIVLNYLALAYQNLQDWPAATTAAQHSLALLNEQPPTPEQVAIQAQILNTQGNLQLAQGDAETALATWQQAAPLYPQLNDLQGHIGNQINQAYAQQHLGFYLQARTRLQALHTDLQQQSDPRLLMTGLHSLGHAFYLVGDYQDAQVTLSQALTVAQAHQTQQIPSIQLSLGNLFSAQQRPERALQAYQAASQDPDPLLQLQARLNLLDIYLLQQEQAQSETLWPQIAAQLDQLPLGRLLIYHRIHLAGNLAKLKQDLTSDTVSWHQIAQLIATAHHQAQQLEDPLAESYVLGNLGHLYELTQQWDHAIQLTEQALQLLRHTTAADLSYQWQWQLGRLLERQGQPIAATKAYQDAIAALQSLRRDLAATPANAQFSFRQSVEPVYRELISLLLQPAQPSSTEAERLKQAQTIIEALQAVELENFFRSACLDGHEVPITNVNQDAAAVIYPILLSDRLEVILSLPDKSLQHYATPIDSSIVSKRVTQLRNSLEEPITSRKSQKIGAEVYNWLIRPKLATLQSQNVKTLVFVLDGPLRNLPMSALYDGQQYLIENYSVALTPGLQLLNPRPLTTQKLRVLAAGLAEERHRLPPLKYVRAELKQIDQIATTQILLDQDFTTRALHEQTHSLPFPIVHLATHGNFSSRAEDTFISAWDKRISVDELHTLLRSSEQNRPEPIELLVLSACQTARGDDRAALGLAGIAFQAGARSTLASLWTLDDETGAEFMAVFYKNLNQNRNKAEALRQAQLSLLKNPNYRHPRFWAPYVLVGNWL